MSGEEKEYIVFLCAMVYDRMLVTAETIELAKKAAKDLFFGNMSEYQALNAKLLDITVK